MIVINTDPLADGENSNDGRIIKIVVGDNTNNGVKCTSKNKFIFYNL